VQSVDRFLQAIRGDLEGLLKPQATPGRVPLNAATFGADEVSEALHSLLTQNVTMGAKVARFEAQFAAYLGVRHAVMVNSGSSANLLLMAAAANPLRRESERLRAGDEVLVPAVTWSTTIWPVLDAGCTPVLVDANPRTLNMSVEAARQAIGPRTRAIFVAHILGNAADMDGLRTLAREKGLLLFEDSCEALGTTYKGVPTGRFSSAATFSFFFSHHITTIEGGMLVTDDDEFADLCRSLRAHGWTRHMRAREELEARHAEIDPRFLFVNVGYNLRATELQAAFGLHQLPKLEGFNRARQRIAARYRSAFADLGDKLQLIEPTDGVEHTWFGFPVLLTTAAGARRADLVRHLEASGIETRPIVAGNMARQPAFRHFPHRIAGDLSVADAVASRGVYWACHPTMSEGEVDQVIGAVRRFFGG
jgi:CDP-6-deoxy-D-xylo-4-hexulose-3-dehydrase